MSYHLKIVLFITAAVFLILQTSCAVTPGAAIAIGGTIGATLEAATQAVQHSYDVLVVSGKMTPQEAAAHMSWVNLVSGLIPDIQHIAQAASGQATQAISIANSGMTQNALIAAGAGVASPHALDSVRALAKAVVIGSHVTNAPKA